MTELKLNNQLILKVVLLDKNKHRITGNTTGYINGILRTELPYKLVITKDEEADDDVYLLHIDKTNKEINDTWHPTLQDAIEQAKYEFDVDSSDWEDVAKITAQN